MVKHSIKRGFGFYFSILGIVFCLCMAGCLNSNLDVCLVDYSLYVRAEDNSGNDISMSKDLTDGYLYLFDNNENFVEKHYLSHEVLCTHKPVILQICPNKSYRIVAWTNSSIGKMIQFNPNSLLEINKVFFLPEEGEYQLIESDIFHGNNRIPLSDADSGIYSDELIIRRKMASLHISVKGIDENNLPEDYRVEIAGGFYRAFTFKGKACEPTIGINKYKSDMEWAGYNNLLVMTDALKVAPLEPDEAFEIKLFYQDKLIKQFNKDHIGHPIAPQSGERMNILIDMRKNLGDTDGDDIVPEEASLSVRVRVNNWNSIELWEEW